MHEADVAVVGAGVVGAAVALALARRGASVALLEAESAPGLAASGTNSGILHTGFDSGPNELETRLILRSAALRPELLEALASPLLRCGAELRAKDPEQEEALHGLAANARINEVQILESPGLLRVPGESVTDPVAYTLGLVAAAERLGASLLTGFRVTRVEWNDHGAEVSSDGGQGIEAGFVVNCAGLHADAVSAAAGAERFEIYPRKGEFAVFGPPFALDRILLPVPERGTKGVLVFPTVDGKVVAGPTAADQADKDDWSVRPGALDEVVTKAARLLPALADLDPVASYAGIRPAGRRLNYLVAGSKARPRLIHAAAIRSTGLTASPGIAEYVCALAARRGLGLGEPIPVPAVRVPAGPLPWWRRTAEHRAAA